MLVLRKEINFYEFADLFGHVLDGIGHEGQTIIYDVICEMFFEEGGTDETTIKDYLRYQVRVAPLHDVINDYGYLMELEGLEGDALDEVVEDFLNYNTHVLGTFEEDDNIHFIFDEF